MSQDAERFIEDDFGEASQVRRQGIAFEQGEPPGHIGSAEVDMHRLPVAQGLKRPHLAIESVHRPMQPGGDDPHAARQIRFLEIAGQIDGHALARPALLRGLILHVQAAHPGGETRRRHHNRIADGNAPRKRRTGNDQTDARQGEYPVNGQAESALDPGLSQG